MIVNKQACKSSNIGQTNIEKTDTFSTSAEISQHYWSGDVPLQLLVTVIVQLAIQVYCILLILEIMPDHAYTVYSSPTWHT